jgi:hypothetical protein
MPARLPRGIHEEGSGADTGHVGQPLPDSVVKKTKKFSPALSLWLRPSLGGVDDDSQTRDEYVEAFHCQFLSGSEDTPSFFCHSHSASWGGLGYLQEALYDPLADAIEPIPPSDLANDDIPRPIDEVGGGQHKHPNGPCG